MYTIKEASARTGVGAPLIRAWERRYGVIRPARTASGYRLYDDAALRVLLAMRSMIGSGWTASEAARAIAAGEARIEDVPVDRQIAPGAASSGAERNRARLIERFVAAAEAASAVDTEAVLDELLSSGAFEAVVDDLLLPATAALGDAWAAGRLSVAAEHAASAAVTRRLAVAYQAAGVPDRTSVVVGLPPGSRHEVGALAFAVALRRRGVGVLYLGADVTLDGWVDAVARNHPRAAVVGVVTEADRVSAMDVIDTLLRQGVAFVAIGGAAAGEVESPTVIHLPERVTDAAVRLAETISRRR